MMGSRVRSRRLDGVRRILLWILLFACPALLASRVGATEPVPQGAFPTLEDLLEIPGVSGHEEPVRRRIRQSLPEWAQARARVDPKGNLVLTVGKGDPTVLFVAHMDETGYLITSIDRDGAARVRKRGGFFDSLYEAQAIRVQTEAGEVGGVIRPRPGYRSSSVGGPRFAVDSIRVDFGTESLEETQALGVSVGDPLTIPKKFRRLLGRMATGRAVDDRAGCAALLEAIRDLDPDHIEGQVVFAWVVEEEIGLVGAAALAEGLQPEVVFAVDTFVSSDSPLEDPGLGQGRLGGGVILRAFDSSNLAPLPLVRKVQRIAREQGIPTQVSLTRGGNDGSVFPVAGAVDLPISWPTVYSHSPVEVLHEKDLEALARLVKALAESW